MKLAALLILSLSIFSCDNSAPQTATKPVYFDVGGYVNGQIEALANQKPTVTKNAFINRQTNKQTTTDINWANELELFVQADINKPAFRNSYTIARPDSLTYEYTLKPAEERLTVRRLTIKLDATTRHPALITALLKSENPLYQSQRRLRLESGANRARSWGVRHYQVEGFQKLACFDRSDFRVEGQIGSR